MAVEVNTNQRSDGKSEFYQLPPELLPKVRRDARWMTAGHGSGNIVGKPSKLFFTAGEQNAKQ